MLIGPAACRPNQLLHLRLFLDAAATDRCKVFGHAVRVCDDCVQLLRRLLASQCWPVLCICTAVRQTGHISVEDTA